MKNIRNSLLLAALIPFAANAALVIDYVANSSDANMDLITSDTAFSPMPIATTVDGSVAYAGLYQNEDSGGLIKIADDNGLTTRAQTTNTEAPVVGMIAFNAGGIDAGADSTVSAHWISDADVGLGRLRFVAQEAEDYYISSAAVVNIGANGDKTRAKTLGEMMWYAYDPTIAAGVGDLSGAEVTGLTFSDVGYIGVVNEVVSAVGSRADVRLLEFSFEVIPEPATLGMVVAMGGAMFWIRRRFTI